MATNSALEERIDAALVAAMKARESLKVTTLRMLRSALKNRAIEKRGPLEDDEVLQVLSTQAKQRREAIEQFRAGGREDLAAKEEAELAVLQEYLPEELSGAALRQAVEEAVGEVAAAGPKDMGRVMGVLMPRLRGRADGAVVNQMVREVLAGRAES